MYFNEYSSDVSYRDRCLTLGILPLCYRREILDLCFLFKLKDNWVFCISHIYLISISTIVVHGLLYAAVLGLMYDTTWSAKHILYIDITATFTV